MNEAYIEDMPSSIATKCAEATGMRALTPDNTMIRRSEHGLLDAVYQFCETGERVRYHGIFAVLAFPVSCPNTFVSVRYFPTQDQQEEIGIIEEPMAFPQETRNLLAESLQGHYFEFQIYRIRSVQLKWGLLLFDVDTLQGSRQFEMHWQHDRAESLGRYGKVLLDVHNNRFVIPDMRELDKEDRQRLTQYIYW